MSKDNLDLDNAYDVICLFIDNTSIKSLAEIYQTTPEKITEIIREYFRFVPRTEVIKYCELIEVETL